MRPSNRPSSKHSLSNSSKRTQKTSYLGQLYEKLEPRNLLAGDIGASNFVPDHVTLRTPQVLIADVLVQSRLEVQENVFAQRVLEEGSSNDGVWKTASREVLKQTDETRTNHTKATSFSLLEMNLATLKKTLASAPLEFTPNYKENAVTLSIPNPDDTFSQFAIVESPIMEPELAAKFPNIKTYLGYGIDDAGANIRLDITPQGFHASVRSPNQPNYYVDPYFHLDSSLYMSYFTNDLEIDPLRANVDELLFSDTGELIYSQSSDGQLEEDHDDHDHDHDDHDHDDHDHDDHEHDGHDHGDHSDADHSHDDHTSDSDPDIQQGFDEGGGNAPHGAELRTFRLAVAATGEYTTFHGGTVELGQASIVTAVNRVNQIYENDVAVRMVLVANNDLLVYTNSTSDPYSNDSGVAMLAQNQTNVDSVIGNANYDVGHVFSTGGGGVASLGVIGQTGSKARGVTGLPSPTGDPFWVDYVAHEMGHQYAGAHTFNGDSNSCATNRSGGAAYEPGSGSTIQAYAGICGDDNLQGNSDAFFHSVSIDQIRQEVTTGTGDAAAQVTSLSNNIPTVSAGLDFVIPDQTPFELTAVGSDADAGDVLTYSWEQRNLGVQRDLNAPDNGSSPIFRSYLPTTDSSRTFPRLNELLNGATPIGEQLPTTNWNDMNFRVVVRDNAAGGGAVNTDDMSIQVVDSGDGFAVTSQSVAGTSWDKEATETISWDVAGTTGNGINAANVDIFFSSDGGQNFDTILASGVANDGSHDILVPDVSTALGRIKVKASDNIFFAINSTNILIDVALETDEYSSDDTPVNIVDLQTITSTINVPDDGIITDVDMKINITHTFVSDLIATLTAPDGTVVSLFSAVGGNGDNFTDTYLDDAATQSITTGTAPFTGSFRPTDTFSNFNDKSKMGDWVLSIEDTFNQDDGTLDSWSLVITTLVGGSGVGPLADADAADDEASESAVVGTPVGVTAFADDPDAGDTVSYTLTADAGGLFAIDSGSGIVTVAGVLDYETTTSHLITVEATSTDGSSVTEDFTIGVLNDDDAALVSRRFYYNGSSYDDGSVNGEAPNKSVLLPNETATFENYTSYSRGINGFVIDVEDFTVAPTLATAGDFFEFSVGNDDTPAGWAVAPTPTGLVYESNLGGGSTDRVSLTWADNAIEKTWLEIKVLASATTGLATEDVFYIGNAIGESGNDPANAIVNLIDVAGARENQTGFGTADILNPFDYDRDGRVNLIDVAIARQSQSGFTPLNLITPGGSGGRGVSGGKDGGGLNAGLNSFSGIGLVHDLDSGGDGSDNLSDSDSPRLNSLSSGELLNLEGAMESDSSGIDLREGNPQDNQESSSLDFDSLALGQLDSEFSNF